MPMPLFRRSSRRNVPTPEAAPHHGSENPLFPRGDQPLVAQFRARVLWSFLAVLGCLFLGFVVYGPWLRVDSITINGTQALDPRSVKAVTAEIIDRQRWLIIPNRNMWLLSGRWLGDQLRHRISAKLSIEGVVVKKDYPHALTITIHERIAAWDWQTDTQKATVDRHGIVMSLIGEPTTSLPVIIDQANPTLTVDRAVVRPEVASALETLAVEFSRHQLVIDHFILPVPTCPTLVTPEPTTSFPIINAANTNSILLNTNASPLTTNVQSAPQPPCNLEQLHASSQEIHLQLEHGPAVYFDRHENLPQAVNALVQVLAHPSAPITKYIDLRFGDRVYVQ